MGVSVYFKLYYVALLTVLYNAIVCKTVLFRKSIIRNYQLNNTSELQSVVVCDTILIDGNYQQHIISLVTLVLLSDLCKRKHLLQNVIFERLWVIALWLLLFLWANLENILRILIFADFDLPRNSTKIGRRKNFPFYGI